MTEQTKPADGADAPAPTADDLNLIDDRLADVGKTDDELWAELEADEKGASGADKPADASAPFVDDDTTEAADAAQQAKAGDSEGDGADKAADDPDKAGDDAGKDGGEADIWAEATPEQRAAFEALRTEKDQLQHNVKSNAGRLSALQRRINELQRDAEPRTQGEGDKERPDPKAVLETLKTDYPEIAGPLSEVLGHITGQIDELDKADNGRREAAKEELTQAEAEYVELVEAETERLEATHPDYKDFLKANGGKKLAAWIDDQPRRIRDAFGRNGQHIVDADAAILFLDAYKQFVNGDKPADDPKKDDQPGDPPDTSQQQQLKDRRQRQLDATATPRPQAGRPTVSGIPQDGDAQAIWDAFEAQERASA